MIRINQLRLTPVKSENKEAQKSRLIKKAARILGIQASDISTLEIARRSIDARKKSDIFLLFCVDVCCKNEAGVLKRCRDKNVTAKIRTEYSATGRFISSSENTHRPVIAGFGPAGMFAAYILAQNGLDPLVIERGRDVDRRQRDVEGFWASGKTDPVSNVQFGEGGAGTFSDGKLNTGIKDPSGRIGFVLETFVKMGAPAEILYEQHPHIGTDILRTVVRNLRLEIIRLGGQVRFETCLRDLSIEDNRLRGIWVNESEMIEADRLILAPGHSARDTFKMLQSAGLKMESKSFAVGYRVIHPQDMINLSQYGEKFKDFFGAAPYKLSAKAPDGRGVYSFCMCPGGYVVNASSLEDRLCVNGMSYSKRDGRFANSAIIMSVGPDDFYALTKGTVPASDPLIGMYFQDILEKRAFDLSGGRIPVQLLSDYIPGKASDPIDLTDAVRGSYAPASLRGLLTAPLENAFIFGMGEFGKKISDFDGPGAVIAGLESRTSSPVRITRGASGQSEISGIFPCGEGAGYAGGITSAAVDGIKAAEYVMNSLASQNLS